MLKVVQTLSWGLWLAVWMIALPVAPAGAIQNGPNYPTVTETDSSLQNRVRVAYPKKTPPFLIDSIGRKGVLEKITIGRLELRRQDYDDLKAGSPVRFDPLEWLRIVRHQGPKPAASLTFDLRWRAR